MKPLETRTDAIMPVGLILIQLLIQLPQRAKVARQAAAGQGNASAPNPAHVLDTFRPFSRCPKTHRFPAFQPGDETVTKLEAA
jgi:hypothetical protein